MRLRACMAVAIACCGLLQSARAEVHYVAIASTNPVPPYLTWDTAATNIQDAIDVSVSNDTVLVSNGVYATGGRVVHGSVSNRVAITNAITLRSVSGPGDTIIEGPGTNSGCITRCAFVGTNASLVGFTLTKGVSWIPVGVFNDTTNGGGGAWCEPSGTISNCIISDNWAGWYGGGSYGGKLYNCRLTGNEAYMGGGSCSGTLSHCTLSYNSAYNGGAAANGILFVCSLSSNRANNGAGAYNSALSNCVVWINVASGVGGGACHSTLHDCTLSNNHAIVYGGGVYASTAITCRIVNNSASNAGGGSAYGRLHGCVLSGNSATNYGGASNDGILTDCTLSGNRCGYTGGGTYQSRAIRCTYTSNSAPWGGGASGDYSVSGSVLSNCTLSGNTAQRAGGGSWQGKLINCLVVGNQSGDGGGTWGSSLYNCTVSYNTAINSGGGCSRSTVHNGIVYFNNAPVDANCSLCTDYFSCTLPLATNGLGNITNDPQFVDAAAGNFHLRASSPCIDRGSNGYVRGVTDLDGNPRIIGETVDLGAYECRTHFVALAGTNPVSPYFTWATAATNIQDAIDVSVSNDTVLVSNGVYATGGRVTPGAALSNRVVVTNAIVLASVNGPKVTTIQGQGAVGTNPIRCVFLTNAAMLSGFTITKGFTYAGSAPSKLTDGGGVYSIGCTVSNCVITGNGAGDDAGGAYGGTIIDCVITSNSAGYGGGVSFFQAPGILENCVIDCNTASMGGGVYGGVANKCMFVANAANNFGGGACGDAFANCAYSNCVFTGNHAKYGGGLYRPGALFSAELVGSVLAGNVASISGGGVQGATLNNCIIYFNNAPSGENCSGSALNFSCSAQIPTNGSGNITNDPQFVDAANSNFHLLASSPCIDRGNNAYATNSATDLDGNPRIAYGVVDMGAYEAQFPVGYWVWAGAITNGQTNLTDSATGDGYPNLLKYATGGSPTNSDELAAMDGDLGAGLFALRFNRNTNASDVTLVVEGSDAATNDAPWRGLATNALGSWGGATNVVESGTGTPVSVTVQDTALFATNRFLRVRVTRP